MRYVFLIMLFWYFGLSTSLAQQQTISKPTSEIVQSIAKKNNYESQFVGFAGSPSEQYKNYQDLKTTATKEELKTLLAHKNAVVRIYSFKSLYDQDPELARKWSAVLMKDTTEFMTLQGCIAGTIMVKTYVSRLLKNKD